jgi:DNA-binding NtrC family response regulator
MGENARILVVDDDDGIRKAMEINLEEEGYVVETAETGVAALKKISSTFYNLALIDIRLGDMDGIDLLELINERCPEMVKIMITGYPTLNNAIEAVNKGADGYILKPVKFDELLVKIKNFLRKQQEDKNYDEDKVASFIENRVREIKSVRDQELDAMEKYYKPI